MAQAITDYVKFLADARDAVYRVNCDSRTARQLEAEESQKEKELASLKKEVADTISRTVKARRDEIESGYDREIAKGQDRLKKARAKREKAKDKGVKERIAEETSQLRDHNRDLKIQLKTMFKKDRVPAFANTTFFYALYYPRGMKEFGIGFLTFLICFLAFPCGIYFLIPERKWWYLAAVYVADVFLFGGLYLMVGNRIRTHYQDVLKKGREIRNLLRDNHKKIHVITRTIQKDGNEALYDLEKYDDEIACASQELSEIAERKKDAVSNFENVTRTIISDEIEGNRREEMLALEEEIKELSAQLHSLEDSIRDQNIHITDTFGPYLGNEFLEPDRLSELSKLIQSGSAANISSTFVSMTGTSTISGYISCDHSLSIVACIVPVSRGPAPISSITELDAGHPLTTLSTGSGIVTSAPDISVTVTLSFCVSSGCCGSGSAGCPQAAKAAIMQTANRIARSFFIS